MSTTTREAPQRQAGAPETGTEIGMVTDEAGFHALARDWDDLFTRAAAPRLTQSHEWCRAVWDTLLRPSGDKRLHCVTLHRQGRLVLVLPMVLAPLHRFWTAAAPIATQIDYTDILVEAGDEAEALAALAWRAFEESRAGDLVLLDRVREDSAFFRVLKARNFKTFEIEHALYTQWQGYDDWKAYWRPSSSTRSTIDRRQRRLAELGPVSFRVIEDREEYRAAVAWTMAHKKSWTDEKHKNRAPWLDVPAYEELLASGIDIFGKAGRLAVFALYSGDRLIATQINRVDSVSVECCHLTYDLEFSKYTPGLILAKLILEWAYNNRLPYDFLFNHFEWKKRLSTGTCMVHKFRLAMTARGWAHERIKAAKDPLSHWLKARRHAARVS